MTEPVELHVPCPDEAVARRIAGAAVEAQLAACANVFGPMRSVFRWEGAVAAEEEWLLALKSRGARVEALCDLVRRDHPYDVPVITWTQVAADAATRDWIAAETP